MIMGSYNIELDELICSEVYINENAVDYFEKKFREKGLGAAPPISVYIHEAFGAIIRDGNARALAAWNLGYDRIPAVNIQPDEDGLEYLLRGARTALARGIRGLRDITPFNLTKDRETGSMQPEHHEDLLFEWIS